MTKKTVITEIYTEFINSKQDTLVYTYPVSLLKTILPKTKGFTIFSESIKNGTFEDIENFKNKNDLPQNIAESLNSYISQLNKNYGRITAYKLFGIDKRKVNG